MRDKGNKDPMPDGFDLSPTGEPICNIMAEEAVLGALLANSRRNYDLVSDYLRPEHFFDARNRAIYDAIRRRSEEGRESSAVILKAELDPNLFESELGGAAYLSHLYANMISHDVGEYGRAIYDTHCRRRLLEIGGDMAGRAQSPSLTTEAQVELAEQALFGLSDGSGEMKPFDVLDVMRLAIQEGEENRNGLASFTSTGLADLDAKIIGLRDGSLYVFAGRPGSGKTTLGRSIALNVGCGGHIASDGEFTIDRAGLPVLYCSLEEEPPDFGAALVSQISGVPVSAILTGSGTERQVRRIGNAYKLMEREQARITCIPRHGQSLSQIRSASRRFKRKHGTVGLVVVDYLQMMADPPGQKETRLAVGANIYGLKALAKELHCPVVALCQLSREVERRPDKRPIMSDLKETSHIEEAADVIGLLFRRAYYLELEEPKGCQDDIDSDAAHDRWRKELSYESRRGEVIIGKHRKGSTGVVHLGFDGAASRWQGLLP